MKKLSLPLTLLTLLTVVAVSGCAHKKDQGIIDLTDLVTDNGTSSIEIETNVTPDNDALYYFEGAPNATFWPDTIPSQTSFIVGNGDTIYVGLHWFNMNYSRGYENKDYVPSWGGVLVSYDHGDSYEPLYYSEPVKDPAGQRSAIYYNPVGIFRDGDQITVDLVDDRGAGSGEGYLARMVAEDDSSPYEKVACFYYTPETYLPTASLGGEMKIEDTKNLQPAKLNDCIIE